MMNKRRRLFAQLVNDGMHQTEAAIKAGYSQKTAEVAASKLMADPSVIDYLQKIRKYGKDSETKTEIDVREKSNPAWEAMEQISCDPSVDEEMRIKAAAVIIKAQTDLEIARINAKSKQIGKKAAQQAKGEEIAKNTMVFTPLSAPSARVLN